MIRILQCLCPARHAVVGAAYDPEAPGTSTEEIKRHVAEQLAMMVASGVIDPWCGLCGAKVDDWHWEDGITKYRTMEEAQPALKQLEAENHLAREAITVARRKAADN